MLVVERDRETVTLDVDVTTHDESDDKSGYVTVTIPYLDMRGETAQGQARLYFKHDLFQPGVRPPVYCSAYYTLGQEAAMTFCDLDYVVVTPHDAKFSRTLPIGNGYNLNKAMLQWVRRLECVDRLSIHVVPCPDGLPEYTLEGTKNFDRPLHVGPISPEIELPWSKDKQWSLVILDEGAPLPYIGHTRCKWNVSSRDFLAYYRDRDPDVAQLNAAKLQRLMERYAGHLPDVATLADGARVNRLNFMALERLDVLTGLLDYATLGPEYLKRLDSLYSASPVQPLGDRIELQDLKDRCTAWGEWR